MFHTIKAVDDPLHVEPENVALVHRYQQWQLKMLHKQHIRPRKSRKKSPPHTSPRCPSSRSLIRSNRVDPEVQAEPRNALLAHVFHFPKPLEGFSDWGLDPRVWACSFSLKRGFAWRASGRTFEAALVSFTLTMRFSALALICSPQQYMKV